jgi:uncharacterized membrane protein YqjE
MSSTVQDSHDLPGQNPPGTAPPRHAAGAPDPSDLSTGELVTRLSSQVSELVRGELELARAELASKGKRAGVGAGLAGAGGVLALYGGGALVAAAIAALALVVDVWLAALVVGVLLLLVAGLLAVVGKNRIQSATPPVPEQAVAGAKQDVETVKQAVRR